MPHSHPFGKDWAADLYAVVKPHHVIDVGPGAGMWADVLRPRHACRWTGVEIWEPYVEKYGLDEKYDKIIIADARTYFWEQGVVLSDTLVIMGDVLEHVKQREAERIIEYLWDMGCHILVSVPIIHYEQGELEGNPHETHLWHPTHEWAMETIRPNAWVVGDVVGAYWSAP